MKTTNQIDKLDIVRYAVVALGVLAIMIAVIIQETA